MVVNLEELSGRNSITYVTRIEWDIYRRAPNHSPKLDEVYRSYKERSRGGQPYSPSQFGIHEPRNFSLKRKNKKNSKQIKTQAPCNGKNLDGTGPNKQIPYPKIQETSKDESKAKTSGTMIRILNVTKLIKSFYPAPLREVWFSLRSIVVWIAHDGDIGPLNRSGQHTPQVFYKGNVYIYHLIYID